MVRFHDSQTKDYSYTKWSNSIKLESGSGKDMTSSSITAINYSFGSDSYLLYSPEDKTLTLYDSSDARHNSTTNNIVTAPSEFNDLYSEITFATDAEPAIILERTDNNTRIAVKLSESDKGFDNELHLISYLPMNWWNTKLKLCGVTGCLIKNNSKGDNYEYIHWTAPNTDLVVKVKDSSGVPQKVDVFQISTSSDDAHTYEF